TPAARTPVAIDLILEGGMVGGLWFFSFFLFFFLARKLANLARDHLFLLFFPLHSSNMSANTTLVNTGIVPWFAAHRRWRTAQQLIAAKMIDLEDKVQATLVPYIKKHPRVEWQKSGAMRYKPVIAGIPDRSALLDYIVAHRWGTPKDDLLDCYPD